LIHEYGAGQEGAPTTTREAFTAINPEEERAKADESAIAEVRAPVFADFHLTKRPESAPAAARERAAPAV
jgi:hypothetical protein